MLIFSHPKAVNDIKNKQPVLGLEIRPISQKVKAESKIAAPFFITPHSNKTKSKITEKNCGLLELKLKVGHKIYQL